MDTKIKSFGSRVSLEDLDKQVNDWLTRNDVGIVNAVPFVMQEHLADTYHFITVYMITIIYKEKQERTI